MRRGQAIALFLSSAFSVACGAVFLSWYLGRDPGPSLRITDNSAAVDALVRARGSVAAAERSTGDVVETGALSPPRRHRLSADEVRTFFPMLAAKRSRFEYDPVAYLRTRPRSEMRRPWPEHPRGEYRRTVNDAGFTRSTPLSPAPPDLRVLVVGDSHLEGAVSEDENMCGIAEARLSASRPGGVVEVLNAGQGGTHFYNYLAVVERHLELDPDVVVCIAYSGNDFGGAVQLSRHFNSLGPWGPPGVPRARLEALRNQHVKATAQCLGQAWAFLARPQALPHGVEAAAATIAEMDRMCAARGIRFHCIRLPSAFCAQPQRYAGAIEDALEVMELGNAPLEVEPALTEAWIRRLAEAGVEVIDTLPLLAALEGDAYWHADLHLAIEGHRVVGERIAERIDDPND